MAESAEPVDSSDVEDAIQEFSIDYRKTTQYRRFEVEGVHGGITPQGKVNAYIYTESVHLPKKTTRTVGPEGEIGEPKHHHGSEARVVREVEGALSMDPETTLSIIEWLVEQLVKAVYYGLIEKERVEEVGINIEDIEVEQANGD